MPPITATAIAPMNHGVGEPPAVSPRIAMSTPRPTHTHDHCVQRQMYFEGSSRISSMSPFHHVRWVRRISEAPDRLCWLAAWARPPVPAVQVLAFPPRPYPALCSVRLGLRFAYGG